MGFENVGKVWTPQSLTKYLSTLTPDTRWKAVCLHHCYRPDLALRPSGFTIQHLENLQDFYENKLGWKSGPHFFTDEDQIFGMCHPNKRGNHAVSFNGSALGIEALDNYGSGIANEKSDNPKTGRGLAVWTTTAKTAAALLKWLQLPATNETILFHREDPKTDKTCPGTRVTKDWIVPLIQQELLALSPPAAAAWSVTLSSGAPFVPVEEHGNRPCVPVYAFLIASGVPSATILAALKVKQGRFFYGTYELQGAFLQSDSTWAPVRELTNALGWKLDRTGFALSVSSPT